MLATQSLECSRISSYHVTATVLPHSEPVNDSSTSSLGHLICHSERVTLSGWGVGERMTDDWGVNSDASKYAGFRQSMQTVDSFPLLSSVKCLLECLMTLKGPS